MHSEQQETIPSGWMPDSLGVGDSDKEQHTRAVKKLLVAPCVVSVGAGDNDGGKIRSGAVTKTVPLRRSECSSGDLISSILGKMETGPAEFKPLAGSESPTRRRQMRALQSGVGAGAGCGAALQERKLMLQEKSLGSRSSSLDTEDSGLGEEVGPSDNSESKSELGDGPLKKMPINRPKVNI